MLFVILVAAVLAVLLLCMGYRTPALVAAIVAVVLLVLALATNVSLDF
jgi:hypothetical protein